jgi:hypothetical protein
MSETSINLIGSRRPVENGPLPQLPVTLETGTVPRPAASPSPGTAAETRAVLPVGNWASVSLHFRVDDETREVTVFVVDRQSRRVLRSIPAAELARLQTGELLSLTA